MKNNRFVLITTMTVGALSLGASKCPLSKESSSSTTSTSTATTTTTSTETSSTTSDDTTTTTTTTSNLGVVAKVNLSSTASPRAGTCFALTATGVDSSGSTVLSDADVVFSLGATTGTITFYSDEYCSSSATSATITQGTSTKTVYAKTSTPQVIQLVAVLHAVSGTAYSTTLYGPEASSVGEAHSGTGSCRTVTIFLQDMSYNSMIESTTNPTTLTLTQTSGPSAGTFYTSSDCSTGSLTTSGVTTLTIPANSRWATVGSFHTGAAGSFVFSGSYTCTTTSTSITTTQSGLALGLGIF